jgi:hypothetical protein
MKKIVFLIFIFTISSFAQRKTQTYSDGNISINYPKSWKKHPKELNIDPEKIISFYPKKGKLKVSDETKVPSLTSIEFYKSEINDSIPLQHYIQERIMLVRTKVNNLIELKTSSINSKYGEIKVLNIVYSMFSRTTRQIEYNFKYNNHIYSFYYQSPGKESKKYWEDAKSIFDSFKIIE